APQMNNQLYQTDPIYARAWDRALQYHKDKYGVGYRHDSSATAINNRISQYIAEDPEYKSRLAQQQQTAARGAGPDYSDFYNSPDYQFAFDEGMRATNASLAARGLSGSGRAMKE